MITTTPYSTDISDTSLADNILVSRTCDTPEPNCHAFSIPLLWELPFYQSVYVAGTSCAGSILVITVQAIADEPAKTWNPALELREQSGLSVGILSKIIGVSRQGFYDWLGGSGIASDKQQRLEQLVDTFRTIRRTQTDVAEFLQYRTTYGKVSDLLSRGRDDIVLAVSTSGPQATSLDTSPWSNLALRFRGASHQDGSLRNRRSYAPSVSTKVSDESAMSLSDLRAPRRRKRGGNQ